MLDALETATAKQVPGTPYLGPDPLHDILDRLEKEIEQEPNLLTTNSVDSDEGFSEQHGQAKLGMFESNPPASETAEMPFAKQYPLPSCRIHGTKTGIRHSGVGPDYYCTIRETWVESSTCCFCPDFEALEHTSGDDGERRCKHADV